MTSSSAPIQPDLSVVVPVHNESENINPLIDEIVAALGPNTAFEIVYVDDGSSDDTQGVLRARAVELGNLRIIRHAGCAGQSAAVRTGVKAAKAPLIATLDGDGQNDPGDIPRLLAVLRERKKEDRNGILIAGYRTERKDTWLKRLSSRIANRVRARLLGDDTPDTGCGLKIFTKEAFLDMPAFDHMHRFLPALMIRRGGRVVSVPVNHRPRSRGLSKYGLFDRLWVGITDLGGVMWLNRRAMTPVSSEDGEGSK